MEREDAIFQSKTFSLCSACYYCTLRCPRGLALTEAMSGLKQAAARRGLAEYRGQHPVLREVHRKCAAPRPGTGDGVHDPLFLGPKKPPAALRFAPLGLKLMAKGKVALQLPSKGRRPLAALFRKVEELEDRAMNYFYYPGCSLEASALEYDLSTRAFLQAAGAELLELEDWNCCGASAAEATSQLLSLALPARNIAMAEKAGVGRNHRALQRLLPEPEKGEEKIREDPDCSGPSTPSWPKRACPHRADAGAAPSRCDRRGHWRRRLLLTGRMRLAVSGSRPITGANVCDLTRFSTIRRAPLHGATDPGRRGRGASPGIWAGAAAGRPHEHQDGGCAWNWWRPSLVRPGGGRRRDGLPHVPNEPGGLPAKSLQGSRQRPGNDPFSTFPSCWDWPSVSVRRICAST